jgi:hypothetical protein
MGKPSELNRSLLHPEYIGVREQTRASVPRASRSLLPLTGAAVGGSAASGSPVPRRTRPTPGRTLAWVVRPGRPLRKKQRACSGHAPFKERRRLHARPSGVFSPGSLHRGQIASRLLTPAAFAGSSKRQGASVSGTSTRSDPTGERVHGMTGDARRHRAGTRTAPCGHVGGGAAGCNPESSFTSVLPRWTSAHATLMSLVVEAPKGPPSAGPHVRWGGWSACWLRRRDRMTRRSNRASQRLRKGRGDAAGKTVSSFGQRRTDRRGERGSRP